MIEQSKIQNGEAIPPNVLARADRVIRYGAEYRMLRTKVRMREQSKLIAQP